MIVALEIYGCPEAENKSTILHFSETAGCGVTFRLDSGEPCLLLVAQTGVQAKKSRHGFLGATAEGCGHRDPSTTKIYDPRGYNCR